MFIPGEVLLPVAIAGPVHQVEEHEGEGEHDPGKIVNPDNKVEEKREFFIAYDYFEAELTIAPLLLASASLDFL